MKNPCYIGIDQFGNQYLLGKHPRKELIDRIGVKHVDKMYRDGKAGNAEFIGYVLGNYWVVLYKVERIGL